MKRAGLTLIAVVVMGVAGWLVSRSPAPAVSAPPTPSQSAPLGQAPVIPTPAPAFERDEQEPEGTLRLSGEVLDPGQVPVAGAEVTLDTHPQRRVRTGPDGHFVFERLLPRRYVLAARLRDAVAGPLEIRVTPTLEPLVLVLHSAAAIEAWVVDAVGHRPIEGARVEVESSPEIGAVTDGEGKARLLGVWAGRQVVRATAPGYAPARAAVVQGGTGAVASATLVLRAGAPVSGRARDAAGAPVPGVHVRAIATSALGGGTSHDPGAVLAGAEAVTDAEGRWSLAAVPQGAFRFSAVHPRFAQALSPTLILDGQTPREGVDFTLQPGAVLRGQVVDRHQAPVPGARVEARSGGNGGLVGLRVAAFTDDSGRFTLNGLPLGRMRVDARGEQASALAQEVDLSSGAGEVTLVLDAEGTLSGTVVSPDGAPVAGAQVVAVPDDPALLAGLAESRVGRYAAEVSDGAGRFTLGGLRDGAYRVRATVERSVQQAGFWLTPGVLARTGETGVQVPLHTPGTVTGRVELEGGGAPDDFSVGLTLQAPVAFHKTDGAFTLTDVPAGRQVLSVSASGWAPKNVEDVEIEEGKATDVGTIMLEAGRVLTGTVRDGQGSPVEGAQVLAAPQILGDGKSLGGAAAQARTDAQGGFTLRGLGSGALTVVAEHPTLGRSSPLAVPLGDGEAPLELVLHQEGTLEGTVRRGGQPVGNVPVVAAPPGSSTGRFMVTTQEDGHFHFDTLAEGDYVVTAVLSDGPTAQLQQSVRAQVDGEGGQVDLDVQAGPRVVEVQLFEANGAPVQNAQVFLATGAVAASTLGGLETALSLRGEGQTRMSLLMNGQPLQLKEVLPGAQTLCAVPIRGNLSDPVVAQRIRDHAGTLGAVCMPVQVSAVGPPQQVALRLPPLPAPDPR